MNPFNEYSEISENLRVVDTGKSKYKIVREAFGTGLWSIETDTGSLPVVMRDQRFTSHWNALQLIKNYLDGATERSIIYSKKKSDKEV